MLGSTGGINSGFAANVWTFFTLNRDSSGNCKFYSNGTLIQQLTAAGTVNPNAKPWLIGTMFSGSIGAELNNAWLQDVRIMDEQASPCGGQGCLWLASAWTAPWCPRHR